MGLLGLPQQQPKLQEDTGPQEQGDVGKRGSVSIPLLGTHAGIVPVVRAGTCQMHYFSQQPYLAGVIITPIFQMRNLGHSQG